MRAFVEAVGVAGPGLHGWEASRAALSGSTPYRRDATVVATELLPAERRRMGSAVKLALAVAGEAFAASSRDPAATPTVFTTSCGEGETLHRICEALATPEREVSPTQFHNSVHNSAAGYWAIATGAMEPSTSICAHDASFAAGLLEALTQASAGTAVALVAYDQPYPEPLHAVRPIEAPFGVALLLAASDAGRALAVIDAELRPGAAPPTRMNDDALERVRAGVPAARSLPLLAALARLAAQSVTLELDSGSHLALDIRPCR